MIIDRKGRDLMLLAVPDPFQVNRKPEVSAVAATSSLLHHHERSQGDVTVSTKVVL